MGNRNIGKSFLFVNIITYIALLTDKLTYILTQWRFKFLKVIPEVL